MKKFLVTILSLAILWGLSFWAYLYYEKNLKEEKKEEVKIEKENKEEKLTKLKEKLKEKNKIKKDENKITSKDKKIDELRKKILLKWLIADWDMLSKENNNIAALITYQKALKENPNNEELIKKIWDIYYEMNSFSSAYKNYKKIKNSSILNKDKLIKSLINFKWVNKNNINPLKSEINSLKIDNEKKYYYETSLDCILSYTKCIDKFEKYFKENKNLKDKNLLNIKKSLENFKNFQSKDLYYKHAFVSWAFYENAFYYLALQTAKEVLKEKRWYKPMIKVAAKSAYELWKYEEAKDFLQENKVIDPDDSEVSYFLARVYEKLNDKILSIVHYEKALKDWYEQKENIYRRLIFIYFERKEKEKMLKQFESLLSLDKEKLNITDFNLSIYYNILYNDLDKAKTYSKQAIKYFPESDIFYAYLAWILLQKEDLTKIDLSMIKSNIDKWLKLNNASAMILMVEWIYEFRQKNYKKASLYLKRAYWRDKESEHKNEIKTWLEKVEKAKKEEENKKQIEEKL